MHRNYRNPHGRGRYQHRSALTANVADRAHRVALAGGHAPSDFYPHRGTWRAHCAYCGADLTVLPAGYHGPMAESDCPRP